MILPQSNIMDLLYNFNGKKKQWRYVRRSLAKGELRPTEEELEKIVMDRHISIAKYFKSLGVPVVSCDKYTAKIFPEVLDLLKDYPENKYDGYYYGDLTKEVSVKMSKGLLEYAAQTRLDLRKKIRELVIELGYVDLFQRFRFNITLEGQDIDKLFWKYGAESLKKYAKIFKVPISTFYPVVICRYISHTFESLVCPELLEYCVEHWDKTHLSIRRFLRKTLPEELRNRLPDKD